MRSDWMAEDVLYAWFFFPKSETYNTNLSNTWRWAAEQKEQQEQERWGKNKKKNKKSMALGLSLSLSPGRVSWQLHYSKHRVAAAVAATAARNNADERRHSLSLFSHQILPPRGGRKKGKRSNQRWKSFEFYQDTSIFDMSFLLGATENCHCAPFFLLYFRVFTVFHWRGKKRQRRNTHTRLMSIFKGKGKRKKNKGHRLRRWWWWWRPTGDDNRYGSQKARDPMRCNRNGNHPALTKAAAAAVGKPRNREKSSSTERNSKTLFCLLIFIFFSLKTRNHIALHNSLFNRFI